ncbi:uncharacterized protein BROUX77_002398 [Berkeleyomyces rouxiae]|uniref:uncharacterized protein n=1 Tax=Berkeleyomyces rouxiae TaxID=2035830 RepID=UPI003B80E67F
MADKRYMVGLKYGHAGNIIYLPKEHASEGSVGDLYASQRIDNPPSFQVKSPWELCYTSPTAQYPDTVDDQPSTFSVKRVQKRWLQSAHPQTFAGIGALADLLDEEDSPSDADQVVLPRKACFEIGEIAKVSESPRSRGTVPVVIKTSGSAGEILHIIRLQDMWFQWKDSNDISIRLRNMSLLDKQEEVFWSHDAAPITAIKFAVDQRTRRRHWVLVQKRSSTTILQPEHHTVPVPVENGRVVNGGMASRIKPRPLITITSSQTGGRPHSNMAFTPTNGAHASRLAIIDEMGYWTIWSIQGAASVARNSANVSMQMCGHINSGILPHPSDPTKFPLQQYGVIFCKVDRPPPALYDTTLSKEDKDGSQLLAKSCIALVWNRNKLAAVDIDAKKVIESVPKILPTRLSSECILDIQIDPSSESRFIVLTSRHLFWVEYAFNSESSVWKAQVLIVATHYSYLDEDGAQMTVSSFADVQNITTTLVILHSQQNKTVKSFWLRSINEANFVQLHQRTIMIDSQDGHDKSAEAIINASSLRLSGCVWGERNDVPFLGKPDQEKAQDDQPGGSTSSGFVFREKRAQFCQLFSLSPTGQIGYWMCVVAPEAEAKTITAPEVNIYALANRWSKIIRTRKQAYIDFITPAFVIPDGLSNYEELAMRPLKQQLQLQIVRDSSAGDANTKRLKRKFSLAWMQLQKYFSTFDGGSELMDYNSSIIGDRIFVVIQDGARCGKLPYRTLIECASAEELLESHTKDDYGWSSEIKHSLDFGDQSPVTSTVVSWEAFKSPDVLVQLNSLKAELAQIWPIPSHTSSMKGGESAFRKRLLTEVARDAVLAANTISIRNLGFTHQQPQDLISSSQLNYFASPQVPGSSPPRFMSRSQIPLPSSSAAKASQKATAAINERKARGREAIQRLSQYAISIEAEGELQETMPHQVLASWPKELGVSTDTYIDSQSMVHIRREEEIRKKHLAKLEKKRRQALKYGLVSEGPRTSQVVDSLVPQSSATPRRINIPAPSIQARTHAFTQPSSQPNGISKIAMSQPVAGVFGGRDALKLPKKKKKKKGGIK